MITVSLNELLKAEPCADGFLRALHARGKINFELMNELILNEYESVGDLPINILSLSDDEIFPAASVVNAESFSDALWALHLRPEYNNLWRKYAVWCARSVEYLITDERSNAALEVAWRHSDGLATDEELDAAWATAGAAARATARAAAAAAAAAAGAAAGAAAWAAAGATARATARAAARDAQQRKLVEILNAGEWVGGEIAE